MNEATEPDQAAALSVVMDLLTAVGGRDWGSVASCFHTNATLFIPANDGKESLEQWQGDSERLRDRLEQYSAESNRVDLRQVARRLQVEVLGQSAIVWLRLPGSKRRQREIVLHQSEGLWLVVHFHVRLFDELNRLRSVA